MVGNPIEWVVFNIRQNENKTNIVWLKQYIGHSNAGIFL
jgi:hypothetical protein